MYLSSIKTAPNERLIVDNEFIIIKFHNAADWHGQQVEP